MLVNSRIKFIHLFYLSSKSSIARGIIMLTVGYLILHILQRHLTVVIMSYKVRSSSQLLTFILQF